MMCHGSVRTPGQSSCQQLAHNVPCTACYITYVRLSPGGMRCGRANIKPEV
jgi:hypothetical protein